MKALLGSLDRSLSTVLLGPPYPAAREWTNPAPSPDPWNPDHRERYGEGFKLADDIVCFQRGRCPEAMFEGYVRMDTVCFNHGDEYDSVRKCIVGLPFDFIVLALDQGEVVSGCMIEFRCADEGPSYIYLSSLCTLASHGGRGLAHRVVHAVKVLGMILMHEGPECYPIRNQQLYIGLCVRKLKPPSGDGPIDDERLIKLYESCGFHRRDDQTPAFKYKTFTRCSVYPWDLDQDPNEFTSMWFKVDAALS